MYVQTRLTVEKLDSIKSVRFKGHEKIIVKYLLFV